MKQVSSFTKLTQEGWSPVWEQIPGYTNLHPNKKSAASKYYRRSNPHLEYAMSSYCDPETGRHTCLLMYRDPGLKTVPTRLTVDKSNGPTFSQAMDQFLAEKDLSPKTKRDYQYRGKQFVKFCLKGIDRPILQVSARTVNKWKEARPGFHSPIEALVDWAKRRHTQPVQKPMSIQTEEYSYDWVGALNAAVRALDDKTKALEGAITEITKLREALELETERARQFEHRPNIERLEPRAREFLTNYHRR